LGYLHAQERFFQMDGQRRMAAGELAGLAGAALLSQDRERRVHRFRHRARAVLAAMSPEERKVLDAYVAGVNRGLSSLETAPFEYMLLRSTPNPWTAEDTVLTVYAMYLDLQEADGATELRRALAEETLGQPMATFLFPEGTSWDAPLDGSSLPLPAMPDSRAAKRADNLIPTAEDEVEVASPGSNS
jgi:penicillin amidase